MFATIPTFLAATWVKELKAGISPERAIEIAKTIYCIKAIKPKSKEPIEKILLLTEEQKLLGKCFGF